jgi:Rrf2 family protein
MRISAKAEYAVRAAAELAARALVDPQRRMTTEEIAGIQGIPRAFLHDALTTLRRAGIVDIRRGADGGSRLARDPATITVADVLRAVDGPLEVIQDVRPEHLTYGGAASHLPTVWIAARAGLRRVLEGVTLADLARGALPPVVQMLSADPADWAPR